MTEETTPDPQPVEGDLPGWAFATEEEQYEETYTVSGTQPVLGHKPGETFNAKLTKQQREDFIQYGHLRAAISPQEIEQAEQSQSQPQFRTEEPTPLEGDEPGTVES